MNKQIQDEQDNSKYMNELTLTLNPKNMEAGEISVRALTAIMGGLQALIDSIANTRTKTFELIANNHEKITGKIAKDALKTLPPSLWVTTVWSPYLK